MWVRSWFPFLQGSNSAWMATWILPVVMALTTYLVPDIAPYYYGAAAVCARAAHDDAGVLYE